VWRSTRSTHRHRASEARIDEIDLAIDEIDRAIDEAKSASSTSRAHARVRRQTSPQALEATRLIESIMAGAMR
jgi:hypothetical protein